MTLYLFAELPRISTEYLQVEVEARDRGRRANLLGTGLWFAFAPEGVEPGLNDWHPGQWQSLNGTYVARCLIGAPPVVLDPGEWVVWVRVVANPEQPARAVGMLKIT